MKIHRSNQSIQPILTPPKHDPDELKTPKQIRLESETNIRNEQSKQMVNRAVSETYHDLQKLVRNTEYNVSIELDDHGANKQFSFTLKNTGEELAAFPPDVAVKVAEQAKHTTVGLLMDVHA